MNQTWLIVPVAYLLGSIPFGLLIVKIGGEDIRQSGSGNIGAANVARNAGPLAGALTLFFDAAKGYLAVWVAGRIAPGHLGWQMAAACAAVAGHVFPVWLGFRGGKGVATGLGVFLSICWQAIAAAAALWMLVVLFWRYSSLASIVATCALPVVLYFLYAPGHAPPDYVTWPTLAIALLILFKHRSNLLRLLAGTETRLGRKAGGER